MIIKSDKLAHYFNPLSPYRPNKTDSHQGVLQFQVKVI